MITIIFDPNNCNRGTQSYWMAMQVQPGSYLDVMLSYRYHPWIFLWIYIICMYLGTYILSFCIHLCLKKIYYTVSSSHLLFFLHDFSWRHFHANTQRLPHSFKPLSRYDVIYFVIFLCVVVSLFPSFVILKRSKGPSPIALFCTGRVVSIDTSFERVLLYRRMYI